MPIEIKELVIKTTVNSAPDESKNKEDNGQGAACSGSDEKEQTNQIKEDVLKICMESVNNMLRRLNER